MRNKLFILAIALVAALVAAYAWKDSFSPPPPSPDNLSQAERLALKKNIVVLGVDERPAEGDKGRSDTLFVVMFASDKKDVALLSVPRDTRVKIGRRGWDKINHAYAYGGRELTQQTVEELLGLRIHNYVMVDFKGFAGLVDAIGGVDIDVEQDMYYNDPYDNFTVDLKAGKQHLDGAAAIQYVRYRGEDGDIGRIRRQQHFLMAVYDKINSAQLLLRLPGLSKQLFSMIKTDLSMGDMVEIGKALHSMMKEKGLVMATVPGTPEYIAGVSYWLPDITAMRQLVADMQGAQMSDKYVTAAKLLAGEYQRELERTQAKEKKEEAGEDQEEAKEAQARDAQLSALAKKERQLLVEEKKLTEDIKQAQDRKTRRLLREKKKAVEEEREAVSAKLKEAKRAQEQAQREAAKAQKAKQAQQKAKPGQAGPDKKQADGTKAEAQVQAAPAKQPAAAPAGRAQPTLRLINCSGSQAAAATATSQLVAAGYLVLDGGSGTTALDTRVVASSSSVVYKLSRIPFKNKLFIAAKPEGDWDGTVLLGQDYL